MFQFRRQFLAAFALAGLANAAADRAAADAPGYAGQGGLALSGYDAVAYFDDGRPVPGDADVALRWKGAVWRFASASHRASFEMNPGAYAPQFGGHCAVSLAGGKLVPADPRAFAIIDGRLYLAVSDEAVRRLAADPAGFIGPARANWIAEKSR